jgi:segregation and condensation protein A
MTVQNQVHLDIFEGPLDLLLYLIKKSDLDVYDIPISQITSEYLAYINVMKDLKLDLAGEFLVMASTLMQIKARTLLPSGETEEADGPDPRAELVNRLLEYQRYKEAAKMFDARLKENKDIFYRGTPVFNDTDYVLDASLFDLLDAFRDMLKDLKPEVREIIVQEIPLEVKIRDVLAFLEKNPNPTFRDILQNETTRHGLIVTFLAILELIRLRQIVARQTSVFKDIRVYRVDDTAESQAAVDTGEAIAAAAEPPSSITETPHGN